MVENSTDNARGPERIWAYSHTGCEGIKGEWRPIDMSRMYGPMTEYVRADLAPDPLGAVKVKPLDWRKHPEIEGLYCAQSPIGLWYNIDETPDDLFRYEGDPAAEKPGPIRHFYTLESAKTAAQADYETRIRSALEPDPQDARIPDHAAWAARGRWREAYEALRALANEATR